MSTITVKRPPRATGPELPDGEVELQEPPVMDEPAKADVRSFLGFLPMALASAAMMMIMMSMFNRSVTVMILMGGVMVFAMVCMGLIQLGRNAADRKKKMESERRDYLRYIAQLRAQARKAADQQRRAVAWKHPDPSWLWSIALSSRLWERRSSHEDFARVRIGLGTHDAAHRLLPPNTKPVEDLEPLSAIQLRRFTEAYQTVAGVPISVDLRKFTSIEFTGELAVAIDLVRSIVGQLVALHAPDELRVAVLTDESHQLLWDWVKWLPHNAHPTMRDDAGPVAMCACDHDELLNVLGPELVDRGEHDKSARPGVSEPYVVVVAHCTQLPELSPFGEQGLRNVVLLDLTGKLPGGPKVLRLDVGEEEVTYPSGTETGTATADRMCEAQSETLARLLSPRRTSGTLEVSEQPLQTDFELTTLLGIRDAYSYDVQGHWRPRTAQRARLQVPIGVTEDGEVVELDLKESAQGGMGPHGVLIGATGSGKSELLRTLVCGLAATHSSEILNLVLVDFKGGATFLGMEGLPHTSAVITNLADELPLVDRMQDALNGELTRRQEVLRESGHSSLFEYEKARLAGASLTPFPVLLVIVDEFSELLASKSDFMDLFVSIGRLGRSLGVHLLLASQRLDEGRINRVEGHLSYRIALRTFSSMESRSVIGVGKAHELPTEPGNGYLKIDTSNLVRLKAAYVSGPYSRAVDEGGGVTRSRTTPSEVAEFRTRALPSTRRIEDPEPESEPDGTVREEPDDSTPSLLEVLVDRIKATGGPPARQVWLPPLAEPPSLDSLLPPVIPSQERGMTIEGGPERGLLRVPVGVIDRPFEQLRELLIADLSGAKGHVGLVGAPQSGKSTALRTLLLGLALSNTPKQAQFYILDFGGGGTMSLSGLPHVGSVATRMERDRVVRTLAELTQILELREARFAERGYESVEAYLAARDRGEIEDPHGHVFLVVDGWYSMKQDYEDLENAVGELAARGLSFGIHIVVTATRWSEIRMWLRDLLGTRFEFRLGDPMESEVGTRKAATVPEKPGRGITREGLHFLTALPRLDGSSSIADLADATKSTAEEVRTFWPDKTAPGVRLLPVRLPATDLPGYQKEFRVCLGRDERRLQPVWHDFFNTPHLMVFGDAETGKTNLLRLVLRSIQQRYGPDEAKIVLGDSRRDLDTEVPSAYQAGYGMTPESLRELGEQTATSMTRRLPGQEIGSDRLKKRDWWQGPELFVVIDDYELFSESSTLGGGPLEPVLPLLAHGVHIGLHLIVSRSTSSAMRAMMDPAVRRLWELGTPALVFSYPKEEGKFIGEAVPRKLPSGRAQLVTRRGVSLIQTGLITTGSGK